MTKSKTILAGLGVVAALGVAALPLTSFAATVKGDVDLYVDVQPAIAMTIFGNNDGNGAPYGTAGTSGVDNVYDGGANASTGTVDGKTVSSAENTEITHATGEATDITTIHDGYYANGKSSSYTTILPSSVVLGGSGNGEKADLKSTITVYTNSSSGYTLTVADKDTDTDLDLATPDENNKFVANATLTAGESRWAIRTADLDSNAWTAMVASTATPLTVHSQNTKTGNGTNHGQESVVYYGVSAAADIATGTYADTIVYTATAI